MSMDKLLTEVTESIEREYGRAGAKFGLTNHSDHESYAILLEEMDEAHDEFTNCHIQMEHFWDQVKGNQEDYSKHHCLTRMYTYALYAACEMIQVAAMAKKAALTVAERGMVNELVGRGGESQ